ncbi:MAG TPA: PAS domain-containing protein, partial [Alphaproteobacteria bacterium]|nr:PAS domain-containing protein [Alphaproteobacteria bacterium]
MAAAPAEDAAAVRDPDPMSPDHRAIFLGAPAPRFLLRLEPEGRFVYVDVNPAGEAHVGLRRDEMVGRTAADLFEPATAELMESSHRACAVAGRPIVVCDAKLLPSGLRRADARLTPIFGAGGEVAMIEVAIDPGQ